MNTIRSILFIFLFYALTLAEMIFWLSGGVFPAEKAVLEHSQGLGLVDALAAISVDRNTL